MAFYQQPVEAVVAALGQLFNVFNARSDKRSAFQGLFHNHWLWSALGLSLARHVALIYVPLLQNVFSSVNLTARNWRCAAVASSVLWLRELSKVFARLR